MKADQKTLQAYEKSATAYGDSRTFNFWEDQLKLFVGYLQSGAVLDVGCGTGRDTPYLSSNFDYVGIDVSEKMLEYAMKNNPNAVYRKMDFYDLDFRAGWFDGFWASASLLHVPKKHIKDVLKGLHQITKKNGVGFISIQKRNLLNEGYVGGAKYADGERFFAFYDGEEFAEKLETTGFNIVFQEVKHERKDKDWLVFFVRVI